MENTNPNYAINKVIWPPKVGDLKLPEPVSCPEIWVKSNQADIIQMAITWATKLQIEWFKKDNKFKTIGNNFHEEIFAKF